MNRRKFIKKTLLLGAVAAIPTGLYAWQIEPYWVEFVYKKMNFKNLNSFWKGKKMVQISDLHIGSRFDWKFMLPEFKKVIQIQPDIIVYTGDFINFSIEDLNELEKILPHFPLGKTKTYAVLGNHDYGVNWNQTFMAENIVELLEKHNIRCLRNEIIHKKGLNIAGVDDFWGTNFHPNKVSENLNPDDNTLLLIHNPDVIDLPIWSGFSGWMLSGHTHGGQCKPPFLPAPLLPVQNTKYAQGEVNINSNQTLYINRALGCSWPIRFNVRPEITVFEMG